MNDEVRFYHSPLKKEWILKNQHLFDFDITKEYNLISSLSEIQNISFKLFDTIKQIDTTNLFDEDDNEIKEGDYLFSFSIFSIRFECMTEEELALCAVKIANRNQFLDFSKGILTFIKENCWNLFIKDSSLNPLSLRNTFLIVPPSLKFIFKYINEKEVLIPNKFIFAEKYYQSLLKGNINSISIIFSSSSSFNNITKNTLNIDQQTNQKEINNKSSLSDKNISPSPIKKRKRKEKPKKEKYNRKQKEQCVKEFAKNCVNSFAKPIPGKSLYRSFQEWGKKNKQYKNCCKQTGNPTFGEFMHKLGFESRKWGQFNVWMLEINFS